MTKDGSFNHVKDVIATKLSLLWHDIEILSTNAAPSLSITGLCLDSRRVREGELFAALPGTSDDGAAHIAQAVQRGAACVLCERVIDSDVPYILVKDARKALAQMAGVWYNSALAGLHLVAVTGTNGKTTTTHLLKTILARCTGEKVGLIGTNGCLIDGRELPSERTTPDILTLYSLLDEMARAGCRYVVMEASSHALTQQRLGALHFDVGVFTNLTQDHLDYHGTMEAYCDAKALLFERCSAAVYNADDRWAERVLKHASCPRFSYGQRCSADLVGWQAVYERDCVRFAAVSDEERIDTVIHIPGAFSLYNALAALSAAITLGIPLHRAAEALRECAGVRGRAEVVDVDAPFTVLIDYAHTPDGLENILTAVNGFADNRVIAVFGCGGDRDTGKRAAMGAIAARLCDIVIVTSDNPRTENPYAILHGILSGMADSTTPFFVIEDRTEAIRRALSAAQSGDVVVLCGKGHETYQIVGTQTRALDEREIVRDYFA